MGVWTRGADMPQTRYVSCGGWHGNKLYCCGGRINGTIDSESVIQYDILKNSWSELANMPSKRYCAEAVIVDNKIYCMGGRIGTELYAPIDIYDIATDQWLVGKEIPIPMEAFGCAAVGSKIYCIGGRTMDQDTAFATVQIYDVTTNTWSLGADIETGAVYQLAVAVVEDKIICCGGSFEKAVLDQVLIYDTVEDHWTLVHEMPSARHWHKCISIGDKVYCVGGIDQNHVRQKVMCIYDSTKDTWTTESDMPQRNAMVCATDGHKIFLAGGVHLDSEGEAVRSEILHIYTPDGFVINQKYQSNKGTTLNAEQSLFVELGTTYTGIPHKIAGYTYIGYHIDNGILQTDNTVTIENIQSDHTITFVYQKGDNGSIGDCCDCSSEAEFEVDACVTFKFKMDLTDIKINQCCENFEQSNCTNITLG